MNITIRAWTDANDEVDFRDYEITDEATHLSIHRDRVQVAAVRLQNDTDARWREAIRAEMPDERGEVVAFVQRVLDRMAHQAT